MAVDESSRYGELWADIYDDEHAYMVPSESQLSLLNGLAGDGRALELGIGTGRVALPLAARGVDVEGLEAALSMADRLRAKPGGEAIPVTIGDMAELPVEGRFRLVYVVFNTFFCLLTQQRQVACFKRIAAVLEPGGAFLLECFVPDLGRFDRGRSLRTMRVDDEVVRLEASRHDLVAQQVDTSVIRLGVDSSLTMRPGHRPLCLAIRTRPDGRTRRPPLTQPMVRLEPTTLRRLQQNPHLNLRTRLTERSDTAAPP